MSRVLVKSAFTVGLLIMLMAVPVFGASINKSIKVDAGSESDGETTVNGSINVGKGAVVTGTLKTVNGKIRVDEDSSIENAVTVNGSLTLSDNVKSGNLTTVNGSIGVGEGSTVDGEIDAVNGRIKLEKGTTVASDVGNVNGGIEIEGSEVGGNVTTVSGDIELSDSAVIKGDLIIEEPGMFNFGSTKSRLPEVVIGPGSVVAGTIRLERKVKLFISESAEVGGVEGEMSMSDAVRFSGDHP